MTSLTDIFNFFWPRFLQLVFCFLQSTSKAETVLLFIHLNSMKFLGMVWEIYFPNSWSSALAFFPHQNVSSLVTFHLKLQLQRTLRRDCNYAHQFVFGQAKSWRWIPLYSSLYNAWTHFLFTQRRDLFKLCQIWILSLLQKVSSECPKSSWSSWIC